MKTVRKVCAVALLACVLAVSASAGEMSAPGVTAPPPPTDPPPASAEATGDVLSEVIASLLSGLLTVL